MALQAGVFLIRHSKSLFIDHYRGKTEHRSWHCSQFLLGVWYHLLFNSRKGINLELFRCQRCSIYWLNLLYPQMCSVISSVSSGGFYCRIDWWLCLVSEKHILRIHVKENASRKNLFCVIGEADAGFSSLSRSNQNDIVLFYTLLFSSDCHFSDFPLSADLKFELQILQEFYCIILNTPPFLFPMPL